MTGPLSGVRVLDASTSLAGPYCTLLLAELGADVIKIEAEGGDAARDIGSARRHDGMASVFMSLNRGKRSVVLDLKTDPDRDTLDRLVARSDVFIHNIRAKAEQALGIGAERLRAINPGLVHCSITGFGASGAYAGRPAYDDVIQSLCGLVGLQAAQGVPEPTYAPGAIADKVTGLMAAVGVLAALSGRAATGVGSAITVPMLETLTSFTLIEQMGGLAFEPPIGPPLYSRLTMRRPFPTADGAVSAIPYTENHWARFFALVGRPELIEDERFDSHVARSLNIAELYELLRVEMPKRTTDEWMRLLEDADIPAARVNSVDDLLTDPHLSGVGFFELLEHPTEGLVRHMRNPIQFAGAGGPAVRPAPRLGEHTESVRAELDGPVTEP